MAIRDNKARANQAQSSGNGGDGAFDPITGQRNPDYRAPQPSAPISTSGQDRNVGTAQGDALTRPYRSGFDLSSDPGQDTGSGQRIGGVPDNFRTQGQPGDGGFGQALGPRDPLTLRDTGDPSTGDGGGQAIL